MRALALAVGFCIKRVAVMKRHKWNMGLMNGTSVGCLNCRCVREVIRGVVTYFQDDTIYFKAPKCDGIKRDESNLSGGGEPPYSEQFKQKI